MDSQLPTPTRQLTQTEKYAFDKPLINDGEKVVLAMNLPDYAYGRCYHHGVISVPDTNGAIRESGKITCLRSGCFSATVLLTDPVEYVKTHSAPMLSFAQIMERFKAEGLSKKDFVRHDQHPDWMGYVEIVEEGANYATKHEYASHRMLYGLPDHGIYIYANGTKEEVKGRDTKKWKYDFEEVKEANVKSRIEHIRTYRPL